MQNKTQYNLDRQTVKISDLSSVNVSNYEFITGKYILPEKDVLEKPSATKRFEYSPLGSELKEQTSVAEKQYQGLNKLFKSDEKEEPVTIQKRPAEACETKLMYDSKYSFSDFSNIRKYYALFLRQNMINWSRFIID